MSPLELVLRLEAETWLYAFFFGPILLFGLLETRAALRPVPAHRMRRWPTNWALTALNIGLLGALPISGLILADIARDAQIGLLNQIVLPLWAQIVIGFGVLSFQSWGVHFAMHHIPILWRLHRVHHTDTHLDVSTTVRFHPLEFAVQLPVSAAVILSLGLPPAVVILYELFDATINVFSHSNVRIPRILDRMLSRLIVTPNVHRIHHSPVMPETNSNFGATLPIWDMVFGTYLRKSAEALARQQIGLDEMQDARAYSLWWAISLPFRSIRHPDLDS
jgi:sterol desaturase/sphingolipid hydroxylase (fatty acid hydroxylase superfamily)